MLPMLHHQVKGARLKKRIAFCTLIGFTIIIIVVQWMYLFSREGQLLMSRIQRAEVLIPGWEPLRDFRTLPYVRPDDNTTILVGDNVCPVDNVPNVLVIVASALDNIELRLAIRKTWAKDAFQKHGVSVAFLVGLSESVTINTRIRKENRAYNDIIVEDFLDTPFNATIKSVMMLKWVLRHCSDAKFVMKTNDDVFLNLSNLDKFVHNPTRIRPRLLVGKLVPEEDVIRDSMRERYMPNYIYPYETYPDYLSGVGYLMSMDTIPLLYNNALKSSIVYLEDVFITGICAEGAGITRLYDFRFYFIEGLNYRLDCEILYQQNLIVHSHKLTPMEICDNYDELQQCLMETKLS